MAMEAVNSTPADSKEVLRLHHFFCHGTDRNSYTANNDVPKFTLEAAQPVTQLLDAGAGEQVVKEIVRYSDDELNVNDDALIFALAVCARVAKDLKTKQAAYKSLSKVCKSPVQLFRFVTYSEELSGETTGWGRAQRNAINDWYNTKDTTQLAIAVTKIKSRHGWSHADMLRLAHVKPSNNSTGLILKYVIKGFGEIRKQYTSEAVPAELSSIYKYLEAVDLVKHSKDEQQVAALVEEFHLCREHIPTGLVNSKEVWRGLIQHMPLRELIMHLGKLTALGLLDPLNKDTQASLVVDRLRNEDNVKDSRLHPFEFMLALKVYEQGKAERGKQKWMPTGAVVDALQTAYTTSFANVTPTNKRYLVAVDINAGTNSMGLNGSPSVRPLLVAACMGMMIARTEPSYQLVAYSQTIAPARLSATMPTPIVYQSLSEVCRKVPSPVTDCALPILWAMENSKMVDVFILLTDCESGIGPVPPSDALQKYRTDMKIPDAKLIVCGLGGAGFKVTDSDDAAVLDIIGFDVKVPRIIRHFINGEI